MNQAEQGNIGKVTGQANLDERFGLPLFRRIELREARPKKARLQEIIAGTYDFLFHQIIDPPDFRAVILRRETDEHDLEEWLVGLQVDWVMELRDKGAQFFEKGYTDFLQVLVGFAWHGYARVDRCDVRDVVVETNGPRLGGNLPLGGAKKNADMAGVNGGDAQGHGFGLERMIDRGEKDGVVAGNMDDGAAAGEIGHNFIFLGGGVRASE